MSYYESNNFKIRLASLEPTVYQATVLYNEEEIYGYGDTHARALSAALNQAEEKRIWEPIHDRNGDKS